MLFPALSFLCLDSLLSLQETTSRRTDNKADLGLWNSNEALKFQSAFLPLRGGPLPSVCAGRRADSLLCTDCTRRVYFTPCGLSDDVLSGFLLLRVWSSETRALMAC